jgi:hypothetical protein
LRRPDVLAEHCVGSRIADRTVEGDDGDPEIEQLADSRPAGSDGARMTPRTRSPASTSRYDACFSGLSSVLQRRTR